MREYTEISAYIRHGNTQELLSAVTNLFAREGMQRVDSPAKRLHHAPALENNRWAVRILSGKNGWHLLRATPWNLWCDLPAGSAQDRFVQLAQSLSSPGFIVCLVDRYPDAYGEVLIEVDSKGRSIATGNWAEQGCPEDGSEIDTSQFYGRKLDAGHIAPRSPLLQSLWQQSQALSGRDQDNSEYDDCLGDSGNETFCRYITRRLMGLSSWDAATPNDWPSQARHTLYFEWPAGDRPEPPEPAPVLDVHYPDGAIVMEGDAVLLDNGLTSGRVSNLICSGDRVRIVAVDVGQPGSRAINVDGIAHALRLVERNTTEYRQAIVRFLAEHANEGDAQSMFAYGMRLIKGEDIAKDERVGYEWLTRAADKGQAEAQLFVGRICKDESKAVRYWHMAAEQGLELAQFELGVAYTEGKGVAQNVGEAKHWYTLAVEQGNLAAHYNLGHLWIWSLEHTTDPFADAEWFRARAEQGDAPAQWVMGLCTASSKPSEAVRYYRMGAEQGFGPAICNLADKYEHGVGVERDLAEALRLYLQAAKKKVAAASYSLGNMYKDGRGVDQDNAQAIFWFKKAVDEGWEDAKAALRDLQESNY